AWSIISSAWTAYRGGCTGRHWIIRCSSIRTRMCCWSCTPSAVMRRCWVVQILLAMLLVVAGAALTWVQGDPARPPGWGATAAPAVSSKPLQLQQITYSASQASAVINGQLVTTGASVDGAKVLTIKPDRVLILVRGQRRELTLFNSEDVKRNTP